MIIRLIAENDAEKKRFNGAQFIEHKGVKEYFMAGNKLDAEDSLVDFHEWTGSYRYLLGTIMYFYELINDDRIKSYFQKQQENVTPVNFGQRKIVPMVKKATGGNIQQLDISKLRGVGPEDEAFPETPEMPVEDIAAEDFVEGSSKTQIQFSTGGKKVEDVDVAGEDVAEQIKVEAEQFRRQGLRIIPNQE
jgi:hypothetical protein